MTGLFGAKQDLNPKRMITRMFGAAKLRADTFKELMDDPSATFQSLLLVPITGLCYGVGLSIFVFLDVGLSLSEAMLLILLSLLASCIIALTWSVTTYTIVTRLFRRTMSYLSLTRPFLFAWTPGLLFILLSSPNQIISESFRVVASAWLAIATIFAVRYSSGLTVQQSMTTFMLSILILVLALIAVNSVLPVFLT